ncbi:MAG TPA: PAS domain-containing protein, partial [Stenomitos sp.]
MVQASYTVLVVDDSAEDRELYKRYLQQCQEGSSYTIVEAGLGRQGIELWYQHQPDIVLLDYRLPDLNGLEFLAQLQAPSLQPCVPVIVVTGQGDESIAVQTIKAGAQDYLVKEQITPQKLAIAIQAAIRSTQLQTQLQQKIDREQIVARISQQIHQSFELDSILKTTVSEVREFLHTDRVLIFQVHPNGYGTVIAESVSEEWPALLSKTIYDPCLANNCSANHPTAVTYDTSFTETYLEKYRQRQVSAISDVHNSNIDPCHIELLAQFQVQANLVVPITHDDQFWGLLIAHHCRSPRTWQTFEINLLQELVVQVSITLRQAELYQQVQKELLERKQVEAELRESKEQLQLALQVSRMGTWTWDLQSGLITWSQNLNDLFGRVPGSFMGTFDQFAEQLYPSDRKCLLSTINQAINTGKDYQIEYRVICPNEQVRWVLSRGKVFYDSDGTPVQLVGNHIDITERKQSETDLQESEERFRQLAENINAVLWIKDSSKAGVTYLSPAYKSLWGLDPQELYEKQCTWNDYIYPDDRSSVAQAFQEKAEAGLYDEEYRILLPNGTVRWVRDRCFPLRNEAGEVYRFTGIAEDITEQKQTEIALADNEARLQGFVDANVVGMLYGDLLGNINKANNELLRITGYTQADVTSGRLRWSDITPAEYIPLDEQAIAEGRIKGYCTPYEKEYIRKDGSRIPVMVGFSIVGGTKEEAVAFVLDISERKRVEERLRYAAERDAVLVALVDAIRALSDPEEIQATTSRILGEHLNANRVIYFEVRNSHYCIRQAYVNGVPPIEGGYPVELLRQQMLDSDSISGPVVAADVQSDFNFAVGIRSTLASLQIAAYLAIPLVENGEIVAGVIIHAATPRTWTTEEITLAEAVAERTQEAVEHARAEAALQNSEQLLRLALTGAKQGVWDWNLKTQAVTWDDRSKEMFGLPLESTMTHERFFQIIHPDDRLRIEAVTTATLRDRSELKEEYRIFLPDGTMRWILTQGRSFFDTAGEVYRLSGTVMDISDQKQAQIELQERSEHLRLLYEATRDLLSSSQPLHLIETIFEDLKALMDIEVYFNYIFDESQQKLHLAFYGGISPEVAESIEWLNPGQAICGTVAVQRCQIVQNEVQYSTNPKTILLQSLGITAYSCQPLIAQGKFFGSLGFGSRNRTRFTPAEQDLFQALCDQIAIALERAELLASLQQQTEELTQVNTMKDEFLAVLSHELRSPLNPILGWSKLMQSRKLNPEKTAEALATIERNARLQCQLIDDLLDIAKILRGKLSIETVPIDLAFVIESA